MVAGWPERNSLILEQPVLKNGGWEALGRPAAKVWRGKTEAFCGGNRLHQGMAREELKELSWPDFFSDPTQWWDNRWSKVTTSLHPHFRHKKVALWLNKPAWVDAQLAMWDGQVHAGMRRPAGTESSLVQGGSCRVAPDMGDVQIGKCRELCADGQIGEAIDELNLLVQRGLRVPSNLFYSVLKRCIAQKDLAQGRRLHTLTVTNGYEANAFLANHLIRMYASHGSLVEAMQAFAQVCAPDVYMWASIILAYVRHGQPSQAIGLYRQMRESTVNPDNRVFVAVLKACASAGDLSVGKEVHAHIRASAVKPDLFVQTCLVDMYAKCGSLEDAQRVFDSLSQKDVVMWTAMIAGYAQQGMGQKALSLYTSMQQEGISRPDSITYVCLLQACASVGVEALQQGKQLHARIDKLGVQAHVIVGSSLVNMYTKCGSLEDAQRVFDRLPQKNVVTWTAMIAGYAQQGMGQEAFSLYSSMQQEGLTPPDPVTFIWLLQACAGVGVAALHQGKQLHAQIEQLGVQADVVVGASLVNMYAKCGSLKEAQRVFDRLSHKDVVTWTAMIAGYAQQGMGQEALNMYTTMQQDGIMPPDSVTFVCLLQACASVAALPLGKELHAQIEEQGMQGDVVVGNSLVNMYAKCGSMVESQQVFDSWPERDTVTWSSLIAGYARQGDSEAVFDLVGRMKLEGLQLDGITFLSVLTVCSHAGLVDKGRKYFQAMTTAYGISPTMDHYRCMMDLLGRAGHLDEALQVAKTMPFQPDCAVWLTLLGACRKWNNLEVGQQAFESAVRLDGKEAAAYVLMSNIYAGAEMWEEAKEMQARRVKFGAWKKPGQTWWTDVDGAVHSFAVGDATAPLNEERRMCDQVT